MEYLPVALILKLLGKDLLGKKLDKELQLLDKRESNGSLKINFDFT
jgi:hypothetical protein